MKRDSSGKFRKQVEEEYASLTIKLPSFKLIWLFY